MRSIAIVPVFREVGRIGRVLEQFKPGSVDEICLTVDSPNESIRAEVEESRKRTDVPVTIIENPDRKGVGHAIRRDTITRCRMVSILSSSWRGTAKTIRERSRD